MEERKHHNRIGGVQVAPLTGLTHEVTTAGGSVLGSWPRSGDDDLHLALEAALRASKEWRELRHGLRVGILRQGLERIVHAASIDSCMAERLGLSVGECVRYRRQAFRRGDAVLRHAPGAPLTGGVALVRIDARAAVSGLVEALFRPLSRGWPTILLSDPVMPFLADEVCVALDDVGLPKGVLSVLHDDGLTVLRSAAARPEVKRVLVRGTSQWIRAAREAHDRRPPEAPSAQAGFGAGVPGRGESRFHGSLLSDRTFVVRSGSDPDGAAEEVVRRAFGALETWSGQAEGSVGRVLCHERIFSRFSEALLGTLEELAGEGRALPALDPSLWDEIGARVSLGLDEGATLILGEPAGSRRPRADAILTPSVFTNAEPRMRLLRPGIPAAVLVLMRCKDDAQAAALADQLDGETSNTD
jgi:acyl-CoA reductase-like NAD-dependent aldehyde dehydrogenase